MSDAPSGSPDDPRPSGEPREGRSTPTQFVWLGVIAALGAVWWWLGRVEPVETTSRGGEAPTPAEARAVRTRSSALPASSEWATGLSRDEMPEVAARRAHAARQLMQRQGLSAHGEPRPDWNAARLRSVIPVEAVTDAGPTTR